LEHETRVKGGPHWNSERREVVNARKKGTGKSGDQSSSTVLERGRGA